MYVARLTAPSISDPHYIKTTYGGKNKCILRDSKTGSVLPNCVGYAWGRAHEILGRDPGKLSVNNANKWFGKTEDGYKRGQTPKVGAVVCWDKINPQGAGHVAVVEVINPDGSFISSASNYSGTRFYTKTIKPPYNNGANYPLQGFIYLLDDETEEPGTGGSGNITIPDEEERNFPFKVGDKVKAKTLVNWKGTKLTAYDSEYYITATNFNNNTVVLSALRDGKYLVWARLNVDNVVKI